jgi:hypothetical protein
MVCALQAEPVSLDIGLVLLRRDAGDRQADRRVRHVDQQIHTLIEPLARETGADIGLVLVVALNDLDVIALVGGAVILQRLLHAGDRGLAADIGIGAGEVGAHADGERLGRGACGDAGQGGGGGGNGPGGQDVATVEGLHFCFLLLDVTEASSAF